MDNKNIILKKIKNELDFKNNISYSEINNIYNNINKILEKNNIEIYDLNNILVKINKKEEMYSTIKKLKKFVKRKNKKILKKAFRSTKWNNCIDNIYYYHEKKYNKKIIENSFMNLLKKYKYNWLGFWSLIKTNKNGDIDEISLFDYDLVRNIELLKM